MIVAVLLGENLDLKTSPIFVDPERRLVVIDMTPNGSKTFGLVGVYAARNIGQSECFRGQEKFLVTPHTLVLLGNFNTICDARVNSVGSNPDTRRGKLALQKSAVIFSWQIDID